MKKIVLAVAVLLIAGIAFAFYSLKDKAIRITLTEEQLQEQIAQHFPFSETYLALFELNYQNPVVKIDADQDRLAVGLDAVASFKLGGKDYKGTALVSGDLKYTPANASFYFANARIEKLEIPGLPEKYSEQVNKYGSEILARYLQDKALYTITDDSLETRAAKLLLKDVRAETGVLVVELGLAPGAAAE